MANIFNDNHLYWVFTKYGVERLASLKTDDKLKLYSAKIGNYDWYKDPEKKLGNNGYSKEAFKDYFRGESYDMGSFIENGSFPITNKALYIDDNDDSRNNVVLTTTIDENSGGYDIRELGIFETDDGGNERLFAIATFQPLPKPSTETNHYIGIEISCRLFSRNLAQHYDKIVLDPTNNYATADDIKKFQETLLFVESNLAHQISNNTQLIGYDRPEQLYQLIMDDKKKYASFGATSTYANFLNATSLENVIAFWTFNYTNDLTRLVSISDLGSRGINLGTDQISTMYDRGYQGIASWLNIDSTHYYTLGHDVDFSLLDYRIKNIYINEETDKLVVVYKNDDIEYTDIDSKVEHGIAIKRFYTNDDGFVVVEYDDERYDEVTNKLIESTKQVTSIKDYTDTPFTLFFVGAQNNNKHDCTILAKDNDYTEQPGFYVKILKNRSVQVRFYSSRANYITFTTPANSVPPAGEFYVLSISYDANIRYNKPTLYVTVNGVNVGALASFSERDENSTYVYDGMSKVGMEMPLFSFIRSQDGDKDFVDSKVCLLTLVRDSLSTEYIKAASYNMMALIGKNPCLV